MKRRAVLRGGAFLLALLIMVSVPITAFTAQEREGQNWDAWDAQVGFDAHDYVIDDSDLDGDDWYAFEFGDDPYDYDHEDDYDDYADAPCCCDYDPGEDYLAPEELQRYLESLIAEMTAEEMSAPVYHIQTQAQMEMFLTGLFGSNNGHFILQADVTLSNTAFRGRGAIDGRPFTGTFDGNGHVIRNLQLAPRGQTETGATLAVNDIGLFRVLGNGATIRNLTLEDVTYSDMVGISDWNTVVGSVGILAGRVLPDSLVTLENVNVRSSSMNFGGGRVLNNKRVGGVIGFVEARSILNITGVHVGVSDAVGVDISLNITGTPGQSANRNLQSVGGVVGHTMGNVNILGDYNSIHAVVRNLNTGSSRSIWRAGGVIGFLSGSAHVEVNNLTIRGDISAWQLAGGVVAHTLTGGSVTIRGTTNLSTVTVGGVTSARQIAHVGGFIGFARNRTYIRDSVNGSRENSSLGAIRHTGATGSNVASNNGAFGGFIGRAQGVLEMHNVDNFAHVQKIGSGRSRGGGIVGWSQNLINITNATNHGNVGSTSTGGGNLNSGLGGILGYVQFAGVANNRWVHLNDVKNHGHIGFNATGAYATRLRNGGIVGASRNRVGVRGLVITNALNTGNVRANQVAGGIVGWSHSARTTVDGAINRGTISVTGNGWEGLFWSNDGGNCAGGIVGRTAGHDLTVIRAGNEGAVGAGGGSGTHASVGTGIGGVIGSINRGNRVRVMQSYNAGSISGGVRAVGGIMGGIRRGGAVLIQDTYNIGTVHSRRAANEGHGILGHRGNMPTVTMERVFNAGNVSGRPIFGHTGGSSSPGASVQAGRRMIYRQVFWDTCVHTSAVTQSGNHLIAGMQGVSTAVLTSGQVPGISGGAWLVNGWMTSDGFLKNPAQWESYPFLAWQTGGRYSTPGQFAHGEMQQPFFEQIYPGASHDVVVNPTIVQFNGVDSGVRTFNPYVARPNAGHPVHPPGNSTLSVSRAVGQRLSVGLISPYSVVGFNENDRWARPIVSAHDSETGQLITHARLYRGMPAALIPNQEFGIASPANLIATDILSATALGYVMQPGWTFTQEDIDNGHVRILMDRVGIENIRVHVLNMSAVADTPPRVHADRNPLLDRRSHLPSSVFVPVSRGGAAAATYFDISGAMWGDDLFARATRFTADTRELRHEMIVSGAGTVADPWIVNMYLEDICRDPSTIEVVHTHESDDDEDGVTIRLPHGGRAPGFTALSNPTRSNNFFIEFRSLPDIDENPMALAQTGTGNGSFRFDLRGATRYTDIRVTPNWGQTISGSTFRTTGWHSIIDIEDFDDEGRRNTVIQIPVQPEVPITVRVVEEFIIPGQPELWNVLIPAAELTLTYDADGTLAPATDMRTRTIAGISPAGTFVPGLVAGDMLDASAPGFYPNYHEVDGDELYPEPFPTPPAGTVRYPIYIPLTRTPAGRVHGFILNASMLDDSENPHAPINGARVTIFDASGAVVGTMTTGADGYFFFAGLPTGQYYTVMATAANFGSGSGIPTPVYLPADANAQAHVFLRSNDSGRYGFMILLNITEMGTTTNLGAYPTTATLTYGTAGSRDSVFESPFRVIRVGSNIATWRNGEIEIDVNREGFAPMVIDDIGYFLDAQPGNVANGFTVIDAQVPRGFALTVNNVPGGLTHIEQSGTAGVEALVLDGTENRVEFGTSVRLSAGDVTQNHYFLGWYRGVQAPANGTHIDDLDGLVTTDVHTFSMPSENIQYFALWGARGIIGADASRITFHLYDGTDNYIEVPVAFDEPLALAAVAEYLELRDAQGEFAFWGWFTDEALDASGRTRAGRRRPTVGTDGFVLPVMFTEAEFNAVATDGNIDLYAIFTLWGDVNDDDEVDGIDLELLRQFVRGVPNVDIVEPAAKVTRNADVSGLDLELLRQYVRGVPGIILG
ncbi:MAG: carboxypeptidase regulatory-like domain-containing protein [Oscillospiraceae bacterium]|nr:carboxypeptidase regulatory-like domain-containing protein [Oscillospiraceae bacterium]